MKPAIPLLTALLLGGISSPLAQGAPVFERHAFPLSQGVWGVAAMDVNADGKLDLVAAGETKVWAIIAPDWRVVEIADTRGGRTIHAVALDADGDMDAAGCSFSAKVVRWWENLGGGKFTAHDIDTTNDQQAYDLKIVDLDGDGAKDILLAGRQSNNAVWYRQRPVPLSEMATFRKLFGK